MIIYSNTLLPKRFNAYFMAIPFRPVVIVRPEYKDDRGLIEHELTHLAQYKKQPYTFLYKMIFNLRFRFDCEAEAYAVEATYNSDPLAKIKESAEFLSTAYGLHITPDTAEAKIMSYYNRLI